MKELNAEISALKRENECLRSKNGVFLPPELYDKLMNDNKRLSAQVSQLNELVATRISETQELLGFLDSKEQELQQTQTSLRETSFLLTQR